MKNALILHGTGGYPKENWFNWLRIELEKRGWEVWVPHLPGNDRPSTKKYNKFLLQDHKWSLNKESIIVGHSSGAVAILALLQALPESAVVNTCYLIGAFKDNTGWDALNGMFEIPFDFDKIKKHARKFIFIHSDDDPYCPLDHAEYLTKKTNGKLIVQKGQKHFSVGSYGKKYQEFPFLLNLILNQG